MIANNCLKCRMYQTLNSFICWLSSLEPEWSDKKSQPNHIQSLHMFCFVIVHYKTKITKDYNPKEMLFWYYRELGESSQTCILILFFQKSKMIHSTEELCQFYLKATLRGKMCSMLSQLKLFSPKSISYSFTSNQVNDFFKIFFYHRS